VIVSATEQVACFAAKALRVRLYLDITLSDAHVVPFFRAMTVCLAHILHPPKKIVRRPLHHKIIMVYPASSLAFQRNLLPVARDLVTKGELSGIIANKNALNELKEFKNIIPIVTFHDLLLSVPYLKKVRSLLFAHQLLHELCNNFEPLKPDIAHFIKRNYGHYLSMIHSALLLDAASERFMDYWQPTAVFSGCDFFPADSLLIQHAARKGIPTFVIQHGLLNIFYWPFSQDKFLLWGDSFYQEMLRQGADKSRLLVCGMPASDGLFKNYPDESDHKLHNPPRVLILSNTHGRYSDRETYAQFATVLQEIVATYDAVQWSVKLHNVEDDSFYRELGDDVFRKIDILPRSTSLEDAVRNADIACVLYSTSGLEAMILNRPLIVLNVSATVREFAWWPQAGGGCYVTSAQELRTALQKLVHHETHFKALLKQQKMFIENNFANRGTAVQSIVDILLTT